MKKITSLFIAALAFCLTANAQNGAPTYSFVNLTAQLPATLATTVVTNLATPVLIYAGKQHDVTIEIGIAMASSGTSNAAFTFQYSTDGSNWDTTKSNKITFAGTGATTALLTTNINTLGNGYIRLQQIDNGTALGNLTNVVFGYGLKISAP